MSTHTRTGLICLFACTLMLCPWTGYILQAGQANNQPGKIQAGAVPAAKPVVSYARLPLSFEANQGQTDPRVKFLARGRGYGLFLTGDEAVLALQKAEGGRQKVASVGEARDSKLEAGLPGSLIPGLKTVMPNSQSPPSSPQSPAPSVLRMKLVGANQNAAITGGNELPGKANYFIGKDPKKWHTHVPTYAQVKYKDVYPGVDLVYYGNQSGQLEYDFVVAPGGDPNAIALDVGAHGNAPLQIDSNGDLLIPAEGGEVRFHKPVVYQEQESGAEREAGNSKLEDRNSDARHSSLVTPHYLDGRFVLTASNQIRFAIGPYDHTRPLVIDPSLAYSTYLGGTGINYGYGIAVDSSGSAYVTGETTSANFPTQNPLPSPYNTLLASTSAFVTKLNPTGTGLVYSTYLGGSVPTGESSATYLARAIAVDSDGSAYVVGQAQGPSDFPTTTGAYQSACLETTTGYCNTAFLSKLSPDGASLIYSTYIGGNGGTSADSAWGVAVDASGDAYVTGQTYSADFPTTSGAYQQTQPYNPSLCTLPSGITGSCVNSSSGCGNAFVVEINPPGTEAVYSTYLGGTCSLDTGRSIAIDSSGNAYIAGFTYPEGVPTGAGIPFPTTTGAFQTAPVGTACSGGLACQTGFVTKLNSTGSALVYSTLLTGSGAQAALGIALDTSGNAYVTGNTTSTNFPTANPLQGTLNGSENAYVTKLNPQGSALVYSTYLGGNGADTGEGIALDSLDNAYIVGYTTSSNFPLVSAPQPIFNGSAPYSPNVFGSKLNAAGNALIVSSYMGGSVSDYGRGIALDPSGNVYLTGYTNSPDFPVTSGAFQTQATPEPCVPFPRGYVPFTQITSTAFGSFAAGSGIPSGNVVVGYTTSAAFSELSSIPLPNTASGQGFCTPAELAPSRYYDAWVPTAAMRAGNFSSFSGTLINPLTDAPFPMNNIIPSSLFGVVWAWPVGGPINTAPDAFVAKITGLALPVAEVTPSTLSFGAQVAGTRSNPQTVTLNNLGDAALVISNIETGGAFCQTNTCGASVSAGANCTIAVTFKPTAAGTATGTLIIVDNAPGSPQTVALGGAGIVFTAGPHPPTVPQPPTVPTPDTQPSVSLSSSALTFAAQDVGTSSSQTLTLTNTGKAALAISSITASGDFSQTSTCRGSVAPGSSSAIVVTFKPTTTGTRSGVLTIIDNNNGVAGSAQTVTLSGTGGAAVRGRGPTVGPSQPTSPSLPFPLQPKP